MQNSKTVFEGEGGAEEGDGGGGEEVQQTAVGEASPAAQVRILWTIN